MKEDCVNSNNNNTTKNDDTDIGSTNMVSTVHTHSKFTIGGT